MGSILWELHLENMQLIKKQSALIQKGLGQRDGFLPNTDDLKSFSLPEGFFAVRKDADANTAAHLL